MTSFFDKLTKEEILTQLMQRSQSLEEVDEDLSLAFRADDNRLQLQQLIYELNRCYGLSRPVQDVSYSFYDSLRLNSYIPHALDELIVDKNYQSGIIVGFDKSRNSFILFDTTKRTLRLVDFSTGEQLSGMDAHVRLKNAEAEFFEVYPVFGDDITSVKKLFGFIFPSIRSDLFGAFALSGILIIFALVSPIITSRVLGDVVPSGDYAWIIATFVISLILAVYKSLFGYLQAFYTSRLSNILSVRLEVALTDRVLSYSVPFLESFSTGDLSSRVSAISSIVISLSSQLFSSSLKSLSLIGYGGMMLYLDSELSFILFVYVLISAIVQTLLIRRQLKIYRLSIPLDAKFYDSTLEVVNSISQIRVSGNEPYFLYRWYQQLVERLRLDNRASILSDWNQAIGSLLNTLGMLIIYVVLISRVLGADNLSSAGLSLATFVVFTNAYSGFSSSIFGLISEIDSVFGPLLIDIERALPLLRQKPEKSEFGNNKLSIKGLIKFSNVGYAYPSSTNPLFSNLNFELQPNKFNVIFGPSGCGKSTLISIILGFFAPSEGLITIDGEALKSLDIEHYRSQIGAVLQQSKLMPGPIRDAISGGLSFWGFLGFTGDV